MPVPVSTTDWTLEKLHALPDDGKRYELVDGELLVSPSPSREHQRVAGAFHLLLAPWARAHGLDVYFAPAAVQFNDQRELQPDLFAEPLTERHRPRDRTRPILAIEVLSPSTARYDRVTKRRVYMEEGINEYWIVDPDARTVERWRQGDERPDVLDATLSWTLPGGPTLDIDLVAMFAQALD